MKYIKTLILFLASASMYAQRPIITPGNGVGTVNVNAPLQGNGASGNPIGIQLAGLDSNYIANGSISSIDLASNSVINSKINNGAVGLTKLAAGTLAGQVMKWGGTAWQLAQDSVGVGGITDGDKGDISVSGLGNTFTIDAEAVKGTYLNQSAKDTIRALSYFVKSGLNLTYTAGKVLVGTTTDQSNMDIVTGTGIYVGGNFQIMSSIRDNRANGFLTQSASNIVSTRDFTLGSGTYGRAMFNSREFQWSYSGSYTNFGTRAVNFDCGTVSTSQGFPFYVQLQTTSLLGAAGGDFLVIRGTGPLRDSRAGFFTTSPRVSFDINATDGIAIPSGTTAQRGTAAPGVIRHNSDLNQYEASGTGTTYYSFPQTLYSATSNIAITNTTVVSNLASVSIPANSLAAGQTLRINVEGFINTDATTPGNGRIGIVYGTDTIYSAVAAIQPISGAALKTFTAQFSVKVFAAGATGALRAQGFAQQQTDMLQTPYFGAMYPFSAPTISNTTVNTTTAKTLSLFWQFGTADADNGIVITNGTITRQ